jgi:hypothetical protein
LTRKQSDIVRAGYNTLSEAYRPDATPDEYDVASRLRPGGYLLGIVGHDAWTGSDPMYLGIEGGEMCWSHADEATNLGWLQDSGLRVHWKRFVAGKTNHRP